MVKKILTLTMTACLLMSGLAGCGSQQKNTQGDSSEPGNISETQMSGTQAQTSELPDAATQSAGIKSTEGSTNASKSADAKKESDSEKVFDFSGKKVKSVINLGHYEQDSKLSNGKEEIKWIVLDEQDDRLLVTTEKFLDHKPFKEDGKSETANWENSTLRSWLNDEFLYTAFDEYERKVMHDTTINEEDCGNPTTDKIFCLSHAEYDKYFGKDGAFYSGSYSGKNKYIWPDAADMYNIAGLDGKVAYAAQEYWLRTKEHVTTEKGSMIDDYYAICTVQWSSTQGGYVNQQKSVSTGNWVRPAMWISKTTKTKLEADNTQIADMSALNIGDEFKFGSFEQDGTYSNGKEALDWYVLNKSGNELLAITKYGYSCGDLKEYCPRNGEVKSYMSNRRNDWLEYVFYNDGFSDNEKKLIKSQNGKHAVILSYDEYRKYFDYAKDVPVGATLWDGSFIPGGWAITGDDYAGVEANGRVWTSGIHNYVRPVIKISIEQNTTKNAQTGTTQAVVGKTLEFGSYEQDNNSSNGKETISWRVLNIVGDRALLVSDKILDCQKYNNSDTDVIWENSSLRAWLNADFYNNAFTEEEKKKIVNVETSKSLDVSANETYDNIFCLSSEEEDIYAVKGSYSCTDYAKAMADAGINDLGGYWLRSYSKNGSKLTKAHNKSGKITSADVSTHNVGVRPALWIKL